MNVEAKRILRDDLKAKGLSAEQIADVFESFNAQVQGAVDENKPDVRHGTSCVGIVTKKKIIAEW